MGDSYNGHDAKFWCESAKEKQEQIDERVRKLFEGTLDPETEKPIRTLDDLFRYLEGQKSTDLKIPKNLRLKVATTEEHDKLISRRAILICGLAVAVTWFATRPKSSSSSSTPRATASPTATPKPTPAASSSGKYKVTINTTMDYNNSVGNDWSYSYSFNSSTIRSGDTVSLYNGQTITLEASATEDDKSPDRGYASGKYTIYKSDLENGFYCTLSFTVTEDKGRYAGNSAGFTVKFTFDPQA